MAHSNWRNLGPEHLPPFPERIVRQMLVRFGLDSHTELDPWPHGPSDILARFRVDGGPHLLKGRRIEQRGERSLFETQRLQQEFGAAGVSVPDIFSAPSGDTLLPGPDFEGEAPRIYYEIQQQVPGSWFEATAGSLRRVGRLLAQFHEIGAGLDTFLLNKMNYIEAFRRRGYEQSERFRQELVAAVSSSMGRRRIEELFRRRRDPGFQVHLDWRIVHGDLGLENLLEDGDDLYLIDWDEVGRGAKTADHGDVLGSVPDLTDAHVRALLEAYGDAGGELSSVDLESIYHGLVSSGLRHALEHRQDLGEVFDRYAFVFRD